MAGTGPVAMPVPERTVADVPEPMLPSIESDAVRAPSAVGMKFTCTVQLSPAARVAPQLFVSAKSAPFPSESDRQIQLACAGVSHLQRLRAARGADRPSAKIQT